MSPLGNPSVPMYSSLCSSTAALSSPESASGLGSAFAPPSGNAARAWSGVLAVLAAVAVHTVYLFFVTTVRGQQVEELVLNQSTHGHLIWSLGRPVLNVVSVAFVALGLAVVVVICFVRRRWALALQVAVLVGGANLTTQLLKDHIYSRPALLPGWIYSNSLPSGHTTVAASVSVALLIAVPRNFRPVAAVLGAGWTMITGVSTLAGRWHRPSDVIASVLVVMVWALAVCAFGSRTTRDEPDQTGEKLVSKSAYWISGILGVIGLVFSIAAALNLGALWRHPNQLGVDTAGGNWLIRIFAGGDAVAFGGATVGIIGVTLLAFSVLLLVRQATAQPCLTR